MHFNDNQPFMWCSRMLCTAMLVYSLATTGNAAAVSESAPASVPSAGQAQFDEAMRALGRDRFEGFITQIGRTLSQGHSLINALTDERGPS